MLVLCLCAGCARKSGSPPAAGNSLRLVSTAPNLTECVCAIGAGDALVGRTSMCNYPTGIVSRVPVTGDFAMPWLEPLLAVRPTHVLETVTGDPDVKRHLAALHIAMVHVACSSLSDIPQALRQLGRLTGHTARANALAGTVQNGLDTARAENAAASGRRPRVLLLFAPETPITAGRHAFVAELLELAGGINIGRGESSDYYHVSLEWVLEQNPDLILCLFDIAHRAPVSFFAAQTGWNALSAVRQKRVYSVPDLDTVSRPGPRVLDGLAQLKQVLARDAALNPVPPAGRTAAPPPRENRP